MLADAIAETQRVDALHPALHDGRHGEPPQRELEDHGIGPQQLFLLAQDVGAVVFALGDFAGRQRGVPFHRIQVGHLHRVAGGLQAPHCEVFQRRVQRTGIRVGIHNQNIHTRLHKNLSIGARQV